jgi:hypothetical protein
MYIHLIFNSTNERLYLIMISPDVEFIIFSILRLLWNLPVGFRVGLSKLWHKPQLHVSLQYLTKWVVSRSAKARLNFTFLLLMDVNEWSSYECLGEEACTQYIRY